MVQYGRHLEKYKFAKFLTSMPAALFLLAVGVHKNVKVAERLVF